MASRRGRLGSASPQIVFLVPIGGNPKGKRIKATRTNKERYAAAIRDGHAVIEVPPAPAEEQVPAPVEAPAETAPTDTKTAKAASASKEG